MQTNARSSSCARNLETFSSEMSNRLQKKWRLYTDITSNPDSLAWEIWEAASLNACLIADTKSQCTIWIPDARPPNMAAELQRAVS